MPEVFKLSKSAECFECSNDQGVYGYLALEYLDSICAIHVNVIRWSHNVLRSMLIAFQEVIEKVLKPRNIKTIIATNADDKNQTWAHFIKKFGFPEAQLVKISKMEI